MTGELVPLDRGLARQRRGSYAPETFAVTQDHLDWLAGLSYSNLIDPGYETEKFLDHHRAKGTLFKDWDAAWRNWMRRAVEWAPRRGRREALNAVTPAAVLSLFPDP